jgi:hypothetical protein
MVHIHFPPVVFIVFRKQKRLVVSNSLLVAVSADFTDCWGGVCTVLLLTDLDRQSINNSSQYSIENRRRWLLRVSFAFLLVQSSYWIERPAASRWKKKLLKKFFLWFNVMGPESRRREKLSGRRKWIFIRFNSKIFENPIGLRPRNFAQKVERHVGFCARKTHAFLSVEWSTCVSIHACTTADTTLILSISTVSALVALMTEWGRKRMKEHPFENAPVASFDTRTCT